MSNAGPLAVAQRWRLLLVIGILICQLPAAVQAVQTKVHSTDPPVKSANVRNVDTLVFCPQPFQDALTPWLDYRRQQGHRIQVLAPRSTAIELKQQIATVAANNSLTHLVLVGDAYDRSANPKH